MRSYLKNNQMKKAGRAIQVVEAQGPEFNPQYHPPPWESPVAIKANMY
jgi:hypothetical protein